MITMFCLYEPCQRNFTFFNKKGISSALSDSNFLVTYPLAQIFELLDSQTILNITAYEFLWGYEDVLISLASNVVPSFVNFRKFGLLDRVSLNLHIVYFIISPCLSASHFFTIQPITARVAISRNGTTAPLMSWRVVFFFHFSVESNIRNQKQLLPIIQNSAKTHITQRENILIINN